MSLYFWCGSGRQIFESFVSLVNIRSKIIPDALAWRIPSNCRCWNFDAVVAVEEVISPTKEFHLRDKLVWLMCNMILLLILLIDDYCQLYAGKKEKIGKLTQIDRQSNKYFILSCNQSNFKIGDTRKDLLIHAKTKSWSVYRLANRENHF